MHLTKELVVVVPFIWLSTVVGSGCCGRYSSSLLFVLEGSAAVSHSSTTPLREDVKKMSVSWYHYTSFFEEEDTLFRALKMH